MKTPNPLYQLAKEYAGDGYFKSEPNMTLLYESMTKIQWGVWTIRVWRTWQSDILSGSNEDILSAVHGFKAPGDLLQKLIEIDRVNAVEVVDGNGNSTVVYKDWP